MNKLIEDILARYDIDADAAAIETVGNGLINYTWKITAGNGSYILQQVNTNVFAKPEWIAENVESMRSYLSIHQPSYLFIAPVSDKQGNYFVKTNAGQYFRLFPFAENSHTINTVSDIKQAYEAAKQFGRFTKELSGFNASHLHITLPDFHNLSLRFRQFEEALQTADAARIKKVSFFIDDIYKQRDIALTYEAIVNDKLIPFRVCHHDTKISNVLFDKNNKSLCVIDLDTVMPGYIISDLGDMMRTYLSPANEEEKDMDRIVVRHDYFAAIIQGYVSEMKALLTGREKELLIYAGKFMIYMQAIRFLADFLKGDMYYQITYPGQNFVRAQNQLTLLKRYTDAESELEKLMPF